MRFAPNGGAVPGDRIVGILTPGEGITIYPIQSPIAAAFDDEPERWLDVRWDIDEGAAGVPGADRVTVDQRAGHPGQTRQVIGDHDGNIDNIVMKPLSPDFREMTIDLEVYDLKHLNAIISQLRAKPVVARSNG